MSRIGSVLRSNRIKTLAKISLVAGLLYFLAQKGFISIEATGRAFTRTEYIIPAFMIMAFNTLLAVARWHVLLRAQDIRLAWPRTLQLAFVGNFFNIALPGAVSGDVVKAVYVAREIQGQRARALSSILFDRVAGVSALVLVSAGALILSLQAPWGTRLLRSIQVFVGTAGLSVVVFYAYLFLVREHHDPLLKIFTMLEKRWKATGSLLRIYEGLRTYHHDRMAVVYALLMSVVIHILVISTFVLFSRALGGIQVPPLAMFVLVPLGLLVTAIPVMPAGIGTGHAAFVALFALMGSQRGGDVFTMMVLFKLLEGAVGGLVYLRFKTQAPTELELSDQQQVPLSTN